MRKNGAKQKSEKGLSAWDTALRYLSYSARTLREMEEHLSAHDYSDAEIMTTMERLVENHLLDDAEFSREFIGSRLRTKPVSRQHLRDQLRSHGVDEETIESAMTLVRDEEETKNACLIAEKYLRQFGSLPLYEQKQRLRKRLLSRGYGFDTIREVIGSLLPGYDTDEEF